jgi:hypothetical protein
MVVSSLFLFWFTGHSGARHLARTRNPDVFSLLLDSGFAREDARAPE